MSIVNILSIDVEDWFQVENYAGLIPRERWPQVQLRVERNVELLLAILARRRVQATFFVLGWVAERLPSMVQRIADAGHEIASHGWSHRPIWELEPGEFREEVARTRTLLRTLSGQAVLGYRAPTFSVVQSTLWALRELRETGHSYDSSIFPVHHDRYGIPDAPLQIHQRAEGIWEVPMSVCELGPLRIPAAGGGYFRLYPLELTYQAIRSINRAGRPAVVYLHPWEFDPDQPRVEGVPALHRLRHRVGIGRNADKLERLLRTFEFAPVRDALDVVAPSDTTRGSWH